MKEAGDEKVENHPPSSPADRLLHDPKQTCVFLCPQVNAAPSALSAITSQYRRLPRSVDVTWSSSVCWDPLSRVTFPCLPPPAPHLSFLGQLPPGGMMFCASIRHQDHTQCWETANGKESAESYNPESPSQPLSAPGAALNSFPPP